MSSVDLYVWVDGETDPVVEAVGDPAVFLTLASYFVDAGQVRRGVTLPVRRISADLHEPGVGVTATWEWRRDLFDAGRIFATPGVLASLDPVWCRDCLRRHLSGDWGDVFVVDVRANNAALTDGDRLVSAYEHPTDGRLLIVTEHDRSSTTLLLPSEY